MLRCWKDRVGTPSVVVSGHSCFGSECWHLVQVISLPLLYFQIVMPNAAGSCCRYPVHPRLHPTPAIMLRCWKDHVAMLSVAASGHSCSVRGYLHYAPVATVQFW